MKRFLLFLSALLTFVGNVLAEDSFTVTVDNVVYSAYVVDGDKNEYSLTITGLNTTSITIPKNVTYDSQTYNVNGVYVEEGVGLSNVTKVIVNEGVLSAVGGVFLEDLTSACEVLFASWVDFSTFHSTAELFSFGQAKITMPASSYKDGEGLVWAQGVEGYLVDYKGSATSVTIPATASYIYLGEGFDDAEEIYFAGDIKCADAVSDIQVSDVVARSSKARTFVFEYQSTLTNVTNHVNLGTNATSKVKQYSTDDELFSVSKTSASSKICCIDEYKGSALTLSVPSSVAISGDQYQVVEISSLGSHDCDVIQLSFAEFVADEASGSVFLDVHSSALSGLSLLSAVCWGVYEPDGVEINENVSTVNKQALINFEDKEGIVASGTVVYGFTCKAPEKVQIPAEYTEFSCVYPSLWQGSVSSIKLLGTYASSKDGHLTLPTDYNYMPIYCDESTFHYLCNNYSAIAAKELFVLDISSDIVYDDYTLGNFIYGIEINTSDNVATITTMRVVDGNDLTSVAGIPAQVTTQDYGDLFIQKVNLSTEDNRTVRLSHQLVSQLSSCEISSTSAVVFEYKSDWAQCTNATDSSFTVSGSSVEYETTVADGLVWAVYDTVENEVVDFDKDSGLTEVTIPESASRITLGANFVDNGITKLIFKKDFTADDLSSGRVSSCDAVKRTGNGYVVEFATPESRNAAQENSLFSSSFTMNVAPQSFTGDDALVYTYVFVADNGTESVAITGVENPSGASVMILPTAVPGVTVSLKSISIESLDNAITKVEVPSYSSLKALQLVTIQASDACTVCFDDKYVYNQVLASAIGFSFGNAKLDFKTSPYEADSDFMVASMTAYNEIYEVYYTQYEIVDYVGSAETVIIPTGISKVTFGSGFVGKSIQFSDLLNVADITVSDAVKNDDTPKAIVFKYDEMRSAVTKALSFGSEAQYATQYFVADEWKAILKNDMQCIIIGCTPTDNYVQVPTFLTSEPNTYRVVGVNSLGVSEDCNPLHVIDFSALERDTSAFVIYDGAFDGQKELAYFVTGSLTKQDNYPDLTIPATVTVQETMSDALSNLYYLNDNGLRCTEEPMAVVGVGCDPSEEIMLPLPDFKTYDFKYVSKSTAKIVKKLIVPDVETLDDLDDVTFSNLSNLSSLTAIRCQSEKTYQYLKKAWAADATVAALLESPCLRVNGLILDGTDENGYAVVGYEGANRAIDLNDIDKQINQVFSFTNPAIAVDTFSLQYIVLSPMVNTLSSTDYTFGQPGDGSFSVKVTKADEVISISNEKMLGKLNVLFVPDALFDAYNEVYGQLAQVNGFKIVSDKTVDLGEDVEYDEETNTLQVKVSAESIGALATLVNLGADNAANVIVSIAENLVVKDDWQPIGTQDAPFAGVFDGGGCVIEADAISGVGSIFGSIAENAQVENVTITAKVEASENTGAVGKDEEGKDVALVGLLAQANSGVLRDVCFYGAVDYDLEAFGGVAPVFCLVAEGMDGGVMDHCWAYITNVVDVEEEASENKAFALNQNTMTGSGNSSGSYSVGKCCMNRSSKTIKKSLTVNGGYDFADDHIAASSRFYTNEEWALGEQAYWFNFSGVGYTGDYSPRYTFRDNKPLLTLKGNDARVRLQYVQSGGDDNVVLSASQYANAGSQITLSYDVKPLAISGAEVVGEIGDTQATILVPSAPNGIVTVSLDYEGVPNSIANVTDAVDISTTGRTISLKGAAGKNISVTGMGGVVVLADVIASDSYRVTLSQAGIYVVRVGDVVRKVVVK